MLENPMHEEFWYALPKWQKYLVVLAIPSLFLVPAPVKVPLTQTIAVVFATLLLYNVWRKNLLAALFMMLVAVFWVAVGYAIALSLSYPSLVIGPF
ncbi:hypothetical protein KKC62_00100 [Patescibacteria group bacterium]|nr:hypothetical protein [Patescibacteria group bacterium]MBU1952614.1 hypothetical protein [Patescibacteria group bacterium]